MAYSLKIEAAVRGFLFACPGLSRSDRVKLSARLNDLREQGDACRGDTSRRLSPGSELFTYDFLMRTSAGKLRHFRFVVSDAAATYGVLRVVYADEGG